MKEVKKPNKSVTIRIPEEYYRYIEERLKDPLNKDSFSLYFKRLLYKEINQTNYGRV